MNPGMGEIHGAERQPEVLRGDRQRSAEGETERRRRGSRRKDQRDTVREPGPDDRRREPGDRTRGRRRSEGAAAGRGPAAESPSVLEPH